MRFPQSDFAVQDLYREWRQRRVSDDTVLQQLGEEMFVVFLAQQQADSEGKTAARVSAADGHEEQENGDAVGGGRKRKAQQPRDGDEGGTVEGGMDES